jgi:hypothetical protein
MAVANVNAKGISIEKGNLVVKMPLSKGTPSSSGKSMVLATTHSRLERRNAYPAVQLCDCTSLNVSQEHFGNETAKTDDPD